MALVNKGITLGRLGRSTAVIAVYGELAKRFGTANEALLRETVSTAESNGLICVNLADRVKTRRHSAATQE